MHARRKKTLWLILKLVLAAALLAWVLARVHWSDYVVTKAGTTYSVRTVSEADRTAEVAAGPWWRRQPKTLSWDDLQPLPGRREVVRPGFASSLAQMRWGWLAAGVTGFLVCILLVAVRWWMLLRIQRIRLPLRRVIRLTFLGFFFNAVVPGTVGGDLVKAYYVARQTRRKAAALLSIFVDRVLGLTGLAVFAVGTTAVILAAGLSRPAEMRTPLVLLGMIVAATAGAIVFLASARLRRGLRLERLYRRLPIAHQIRAAGQAAERYVRRGRLLAPAAAVMMTAHVFFVGSIALLGASLSLDVAWYRYFVYVPLIYIAGSVPLTPGGVGIVEGLYVTFLAADPAVEASPVVALALLARVIPVLWSVPGAVLAITGPRLARAQERKAELGLNGGAAAEE